MSAIMIDFEHLGPYKVLDKLGQGGMGAVYRGEHTKSQERVAIKVIAPQIADQPRFRRRFATEIETLKKLNHPNIVRLIGYGEEEGHLFYSMELVDGPSLQQQIRSLKRLPWRDVVRYGIDICGALKHAHDFGVIHRDLKPANLLIAEDQSMKLTDFGIAKLWLGDDMTAVGAMLGTADYMAPEQAGDGPITPRTDLYALGNVLYACLAGRPPFAGKDLTRVITSLHTDPPPPLDLILPELPMELVSLIHQLLEKGPKDRPPTALAVGNRLRAILADDLQIGSLTFDADRPTIDNAPTLGGGADESLDLGASSAIPTDQRPTLDATDLPDGGTGSQFGFEDTINSEVQEFPETATLAPLTHFRTVDQEERNRASAPLTADAQESTQRESLLSILLLIGLLLLLVTAALWMMQPPSAESLYNKISEAEDFGDVDNAAGAIKQFLAQYPDDYRAEEVSALADQIDSDRVFRRLRVRARFKGGIEQLEPAEQAFVEAMLLREENPAEARELLEDWLIVFSHADHRDRSVARLIPIVRQEIQPLKEINRKQANTQAQQLRSWIDGSLARLDPDRHREFLESVIRLYADKPWAEEEIRRTQDLLSAVGPDGVPAERFAPTEPPATEAVDAE
ncbi:serine/threonine-protein kinase [Rosistilla oblonga]|nr:serine/threonine-protein kinase [Rosistilla oblonga]